MDKDKRWMAALAVSGFLISCGGGRHDSTNPGAVGTAGSEGPTLTLTGCVLEGSPGGTYILKAKGSAEGPRGDTAGTSGSRRRSGGSEVAGALEDGGAATYRLIATGNLDLGQNLRKEVLVNGQLARTARDHAVERPGSGGPAVTDRRRQQGTPGEGDARQARFFRVMSVTRLSDTCGGGR